MNKRVVLQWFFILCLANPIFGQVKLTDLEAFVQPVGNWVLANKVEMDALNPKILKFELGNDCFVNGVNGKAKYLVSKDEYQDIEC